jgi:hypothetical protein
MVDTIDLRELSDDSFVVHFGGRFSEVDATTFSRALLALTDTIQAVNQEVNPGYAVEIVFEAAGAGSFRACLKILKKPLGNLFSADTVRDILIGLIGAAIWELAIKPEQPPVIIVNTDAVIVEQDGQRIVISKEAQEARERIERSPAVKKNIAKTMEVLNEDQSITSFGFTPAIKDKAPLLNIPRPLFAVVQERAMPLDEDKLRFVEEPARLTVVKAIFERSTRKWEFIWNGFKISAPIRDPQFFDRLLRKEVTLKHGDTFDAVIRIQQKQDPFSGAWLNESYEVMQVGLRPQRVVRRHLDLGD